MIKMELPLESEKGSILQKAWKAYQQKKKIECLMLLKSLGLKEVSWKHQFSFSSCEEFIKFEIN